MILDYVEKRVTFTFANGAAGADLEQTEILHMEGEVVHIHQINGSNAGAVTAQLELEDQDGNQLWDGTAKAHNAAYHHEFVATPRFLVLKNTLRCTISGDPGVGGFEVEAVIYLRGIDRAP